MIDRIGGHDTGGHQMSAAQILDHLERLITAAQHPDVASVQVTDGRVLTITYQSSAKAFLTATAGATTEPADLPDEMPPYKIRALHALKLIVDLLEAAKPDGWRWRLVAVQGIHLRPAGIELHADGQTTLLQVTAGGPMIADTAPESFADWIIPVEAVRNA